MCRCSFWFFLVSRTKIFLSLLRDTKNCFHLIYRDIICKIWLSLLSYFPLIRINLHHCEHGCWEISRCVSSIPQTLLQLEHQHLPHTHRSLLLPLQSSKVLWIPDWFCSIFWWEFILLYTNSNWNEVKPLKILLLFIKHHVPPAFKVIVKQSESILDNHTWCTTFFFCFRLSMSYIKYYMIWSNFLLNGENNALIFQI